MQTDWVLIHTSDKLHEIEIIRGVLDTNGILAMVIDKKDSAYLFGEYELYVNQEDVVVAKTLIDNFE